MIASATNHRQGRRAAGEETERQREKEHGGKRIELRLTTTSKGIYIFIYMYTHTHIFMFKAGMQSGYKHSLERNFKSETEVICGCVCLWLAPS